MKSKTVFLLWIVCVCTSALGFPHLWLKVKDAFLLPWERLFLVDLFVEAFITGVACYVGFKITPKTDLKPFRYLPWMGRTILPALIAGGIVGVAEVFLDRFILHDSLSKNVLPLWGEISFSIDQAVSGTVVLRFFLFTCAYFVICKWFSQFPRFGRLWMANILVASPFAVLLLMGSLHLEFSIHDAVWTATVFSFVPNLIFGSLYWSRGIGAAIGASIMEKWVIQAIIQLLRV